MTSSTLPGRFPPAPARLCPGAPPRPGAPLLRAGVVERRAARRRRWLRALALGGRGQVRHGAAIPLPFVLIGHAASFTPY
jgi:hypothetical protein